MTKTEVNNFNLFFMLLIILISLHNVIGYPSFNSNRINSTCSDNVNRNRTDNNAEVKVHQTFQINGLIEENEKLLDDDTQTNIDWRLALNGENIRELRFAMMKKYMKPAIDPCDDFYEYACGNWGEFNPIPEDRTQQTVFSILNMNIAKAIKTVLTNVTKNESGTFRNSMIPIDDTEEAAKLFYQNCIDVDIINARGTEPLLQFIDQLGGWPVLEDNWSDKTLDWHQLFIRTSKLELLTLFKTHVGFDIKDSSIHTLYLDETSLELGSRDDYLNSANFDRLEAYTNLVETVLTLLDVENEKAAQTAKEIVNFEIKLANISADNKHRVDIQTRFIRMSIDKADDKYPRLQLRKYLMEVHKPKLDGNETIILVPDFFDNFTNVLDSVDNRTIINYMVWKSVRYFLKQLDERFIAAVETFEETITGRNAPPPRWEQCVKQVNNEMGMAVGAMFVQKYFQENSKEAVVQMTTEIKKSFEETIKNLNWMDESTKNLAIEKVKRTNLSVGYPDFILSKSKLNKYYDGLNIEKDKYFENSLNLARVTAKRYNERYGKMIDRSVWGTEPVIVNAFFEQSTNRIVIPVGILQPPFYHRKFPQALNYGGIGSFIGHELTHGFDDIGREFDSNGNLVRWWSNSSSDHFEKTSQCFIRQYNNYTELGKPLNGELAQGENIADNGGIRHAFKVFKKWQKQHENEKDLLNLERVPGIDLNQDQLFFLAFAQVWCNKIRPKSYLSRYQYVSHSPGKYRVIGSLSNFQEFSNVFQCSNSSKMNPSNKCNLW